MVELISALGGGPADKRARGRIGFLFLINYRRAPITRPDSRRKAAAKFADGGKPGDKSTASGNGDPRGPLFDGRNHDRAAGERARVAADPGNAGSDGQIAAPR